MAKSAPRQLIYGEIDQLVRCSLCVLMGVIVMLAMGCVPRNLVVNGDYAAAATRCGAMKKSEQVELCFAELGDVAFDAGAVESSLSYYAKAGAHAAGTKYRRALDVTARARIESGNFVDGEAMLKQTGRNPSDVYLAVASACMKNPKTTCAPIALSCMLRAGREEKQANFELGTALFTRALLDSDTVLQALAESYLGRSHNPNAKDVIRESLAKNLLDQAGQLLHQCQTVEKDAQGDVAAAVAERLTPIGSGKTRAVGICPRDRYGRVMSCVNLDSLHDSARVTAVKSTKKANELREGAVRKLLLAATWLEDAQNYRASRDAAEKAVAEALTKTESDRGAIALIVPEVDLVRKNSALPGLSAEAKSLLQRLDCVANRAAPSPGSPQPQSQPIGAPDADSDSAY